MTPLEPEEMSTEELMAEIDNVQEQIDEVESKPAFQKYLAAKAFQDACGDLLRKRAVEFGDFRSKLFSFQKIEKESTDWKSVCRYLLDMKMVKAKDMEGAIQTFTEKKPYGKMMKIKQKDISIKLA